MDGYALRTLTALPFEAAVESVRAELSRVGFGIVSEIDLQFTMKSKLGIDVGPQLILGACRPELAHRALTAEPSIAALLPCNVVIRAVDEHSTMVEAIDPDVMGMVSSSPVVREVASDAKQRLHEALGSLTGTTQQEVV